MSGLLSSMSLLRSFHPQRLYYRLSQDWNGILRSKGFFWLASRLDKIGVWSQAGPVARLDFGGFWWAAVPEDRWPDIAQIREHINRTWHPDVGDCRQELVFIGIGMDEIAIYNSLQACLLTEALDCEAFYTIVGQIKPNANCIHMQ